MNKLHLIILIFFTIHITAQQERILISGLMINDSLTIDNVHIINKSTNKGTVSNDKGEFNIWVRENDTLQFSNIQYKIRRLQISEQHLKNKKLKINLVQKNNELKEIVLKHSENMAKVLGLPNAYKKPLNQVERKLNYYSQASTPVVIIATLLGQKGGIDDIYNIISGNRKKHRLLKKRQYQDKIDSIKQINIQMIRDHFNDIFFIDDIQIPKEEINSFLNYCLPRDIIILYKKKKYLEIIDIFLAEIGNFKKNNFDNY